MERALWFTTVFSYIFKAGRHRHIIVSAGIWAILQRLRGRMVRICVREVN